MSTIQRGYLVLASLLLAACGSSSGEAARSQPPPVEDTVFGEMAGTMDKARAVETTMQERVDQLNQSLQRSEESAGRESAPD